MKTEFKASRLNIRCDRRTHQLLDKAASYLHLSINEFVLSQAIASAERVLQEHKPITLDAIYFDAFLAVLDAPAEPNAALKRAFNFHADQVHP